MKYRLKIEVNLKPGHSDPEGETTGGLLRELGHKVKSVGVGKVYSLVLETETRGKAQKEAEEMCETLLANPTKDDYKIMIEAEK
jgi:phosphoribosylformylglycinamidine synthase